MRYKFSPPSESILHFTSIFQNIPHQGLSSTPSTLDRKRQQSPKDQTYLQYNLTHTNVHKCDKENTAATKKKKKKKVWWNTNGVLGLNCWVFVKDLKQTTSKVNQTILITASETVHCCCTGQKQISHTPYCCHIHLLKIFVMASLFHYLDLLSNRGQRSQTRPKCVPAFLISYRNWQI